MGTAVLFGLLPALQTSDTDLNSILKNSGPQSGGNARRNRARGLLVVSEVSLAVILLVGSALLIRSFVWLYTIDRGFDSKNVLTVETVLSNPRYKEAAAVGQAVNSGLDRIRALPGVVAAGETGCLPLACALTFPFEIIGRPSAKPLEKSARWTTASPGLLETLKIPVKRGRTFSIQDDVKSPPVVIISQAMAKEYWKDRDPLQDQIIIGKDTGKDFNEPARQIVGVVADVRDEPTDKSPRPRMYVPSAQVPADDSVWLNTHISWVILNSIPAAPGSYRKSVRSY